jgi:hypothetical protein
MSTPETKRLSAVGGVRSLVSSGGFPAASTFTTRVVSLLAVSSVVGCFEPVEEVCDASKMVDFSALSADIAGEWVPAIEDRQGVYVLRLGEQGRPIEYETSCQFCFRFGCDDSRQWPLELGATNRGKEFGSGSWSQTLVSAQVDSDGYRLEYGEPGGHLRVVVDVIDSGHIRLEFSQDEDVNARDFVRSDERALGLVGEGIKGP